METVGVRQLKENLSRYLNKVKAGESLIITDRKKEVAVILPRERAVESEKLLRMVQRGIARWAGGKPAGMASPIPLKGKSVSEAVLEDRR